MNRKIAYIMNVMVFFIALQTNAQTVDEILAKAVKAWGGRQNMAVIKTSHAIVKTVVHGDLREITMESQAWRKRPDRVRFETTINMENEKKTVVQVYDGKNALTINSLKGDTKARIMDETESKYLLRMRDMEGPLVDYKSKGHKVELIGKEDVDGQEAYKLRFTYKNGDECFFYLDCSSLLIIKMSETQAANGQEYQLDFYLHDYRTVNGIKVPFQQTADRNDKPFMDTTIEKLEYNIVVDDNLFQL